MSWQVHQMSCEQEHHVKQPVLFLFYSCHLFYRKTFKFSLNRRNRCGCFKFHIQFTKISLSLSHLATQFRVMCCVTRFSFPKSKWPQWNKELSVQYNFNTWQSQTCGFGRCTNEKGTSNDMNLWCQVVHFRLSSVKRRGKLSSSIFELNSKYWDFQKHGTGIFLGTFPFPAVSFTLLFSLFRTMEHQWGEMHVCMLGGLSGLEQSPPLTHCYPLHSSSFFSPFSSCWNQHFPLMKVPGSNIPSWLPLGL